MERAPLGVAVVGAGYWGPNLVRNFFASDDWTVRCVVERDRARLERLLRLYPAVAGLRRYRRGTRRLRVDAIALATPPRTHYELADRAIAAGKHVLVEKPLAERFGDADDLARKRSAPALRLMTDHTFLYTGSVEKLRALRESGELGKVYYVDSVRVNLGLFQQSNVVWDLAPHDVSIINYVLDEIPASVALQLGACVHATTSRRRLSDDVVSERLARARAPELALPGKGAPHDDLRQPQDGGLGRRRADRKDLHLR